eukprot:3630496-Amphidinium_carterae.1
MSKRQQLKHCRCRSLPPQLAHSVLALHVWQAGKTHYEAAGGSPAMREDHADTTFRSYVCDPPQPTPKIPNT